MASRIKFPSITVVAKVLSRCKVYCEAGDEGGTDVRFQITDDSTWAIRTGDSSYDQDHRGCWGAGYLTRRTNCRQLAYQLLEEAKDQAAFESSIDRDEES